MQLVEDHFGEHIYSLVQEDLSDEDTKRGAADADAVNMDDICASVHERAILLSVIDNWKSGKAKTGAEAAYCWVLKVPTCAAARKALVQEIRAQKFLKMPPLGS